MYFQSHLLNRALLEVRSSFIISKTFYIRFWFALGSIACIGNLFSFWTITLAPRPDSVQMKEWCHLARLNAPVHVQLSHDYADALRTKSFDRAEHLKIIMQSLVQGYTALSNLYVLEKKEERLSIEHTLTQKLYQNAWHALIGIGASPLCFFIGFYLLRKYLRRKSYNFQGRLLFFRIATPSVFKLGGVLFLGYACFMSYQVWTPSYWTESSCVILSSEEQTPPFSFLTGTRLKILEKQRAKEVLQTHWVQSLIFYGFFGGLFWILGKRWSQLPLKELNEK